MNSHNYFDYKLYILWSLLVSHSSKQKAANTSVIISIILQSNIQCWADGLLTENEKKFIWNIRHVSACARLSEVTTPPTRN